MSRRAGGGEATIRAISGPAAFAWNRYERGLSRLIPSAGPSVDQTAVPATPAMEAHYFANDCFLPPNALLGSTDHLAEIPGIIVQGRYDLLCPPATASSLAKAWPLGRLRFVEAGGHTASEAPMATALSQAIAEMIPV